MHESVLYGTYFKQLLYLVLTMSTIISIGTAVPPYSAKQATILEFMKTAYNNDTASRKLNILFHNSGIHTRYSVLPDFGNIKSVNSLFNVNQRVPDVTQRITVFKENAASLAIAAMKVAFQKLNTSIADFKITHLITVSCTGIYAPGLGAELIEQLDLPNDIFHTQAPLFPRPFLQVDPVKQTKDLLQYPYGAEEDFCLPFEKGYGVRAMRQE